MNAPGWLETLFHVTDSPVEQALALTFLALTLGSLARLAAIAVRRRQGRAEAASQRLASLRTWWLLFVTLAAAVLLGPLGVCLLLALASVLGLREFSRLILGEHDTDEHRLAVVCLLLLVPATFGPIALGHGAIALAVAPMLAVVLIALSQVIEDAPSTYVRATGGLLLGSITLISGLGHGAVLAYSSELSTPPKSGVSWFLLLVVLTELNDIGQALVGRRIGRHHITPRLSPHKTWEGLFGGWFVTSLCSAILSPFLTDLGAQSPSPTFWESAAAALPWSIAAATVISLSGFLGDLNMSGVKRFVGVKDSSRALPGMGGVLDRVDSLTLTAPCLYWLIVVPHQAGLF